MCTKKRFFDTNIHQLSLIKNEILQDLQDNIKIDFLTTG